MPTVPNRQHPVNANGSETRDRTRAGDAFSGLVVRLFRLNGILAAEGDALARPTGQSSARWQVLAMVEGGPMTVAQIARTLGLARQSVQRVADALASAGLLSYEDNPRHRRARLAGLTNEGQSVLERIQAAQRPWADELGGAVGERDLERVNATLDRVLAALAEKRSR